MLSKIRLRFISSKDLKRVQKKKNPIRGEVRARMRVRDLTFKKGTRYGCGEELSS